MKKKPEAEKPLLVNSIEVLPGPGHPDWDGNFGKFTDPEKQAKHEEGMQRLADGYHTKVSLLLAIRPFLYDRHELAGRKGETDLYWHDHALLTAFIASLVKP